MKKLIAGIIAVGVVATLAYAATITPFTGIKIGSGGILSTSGTNTLGTIKTGTADVSNGNVVYSDANRFQIIASRTTSSMLISGGTRTISWNVENYDPQGAFSTSTGIATIPVTGWYLSTAKLVFVFTGGTITTADQVQITIANPSGIGSPILSTNAIGNCKPESTNGIAKCLHSALVHATAGDSIYFNIDVQLGGATAAYLHGTTDTSYWTFVKL